MRWRRAAWWERDAVVAELSSLGSSRRSTLQVVARGSATRKPGRDIVSHVPFFSREAACLQRRLWGTLRGTRPVELGVLRAERLAEHLGWDIAKSDAIFFGEGCSNTSGVAESHHRAGESATRGGDGAEARTATGDEEVIDSLGQQASVRNAVGFAQFDASPTLAMAIHGMVGERDDVGVGLAADAFEYVVLGQYVFTNNARSFANAKSRSDP